MRILKMVLIRGGENLSLQNQFLEVNSFKEEGWTLGRGQDCDWRLPDPKRFVSNKHAHVQADQNQTQYTLIDTSTNGVFVNGSDLPLGRGHQVVLSDGDFFKMGPYEIQALLQDVKAKEIPSRPKKTSARTIKKTKEIKTKTTPTSTSTQVPSTVLDPILVAFLEGLGVKSSIDLTPDEWTTLMKTVGLYLKRSLKGFRELLSSATSLSKEFSPDSGYALSASDLSQFLGRMDRQKLEWEWDDFLKDPSLYSTLGVEAVSDYIQYLKDHELSLCVAIDAAIASVIKQFDPQLLQSTFDRMSKPGFFTSQNKAQYWDKFNAYFRRFKEENQGYQSLFNEQFADAYEKQMSRLAAIHGNWKRLLKKKVENVGERDVTTVG